MVFLLICVLCIFLYVGEGRSEGMVETVCVDVYKQPSLDHPALLNHKIQMKPTFPTKSKVSEVPTTTTGRPYSFMNNAITCPEGMVPIQRRRGNNISDIDQNIQLLAQNQYFSKANIQSNTNLVSYRGASAEIRVQNPPTEGDQFSLALIRVVDDYKSNEIIYIAAGWGVGLEIFGDTKTHLYGSFKVGGQVCVGTINCKGFVQIDRSVYIGLPFPDAVSDPKRQITVEVKISEDQGTGNWWLTVMGEKGEIKVGYWPKDLLGTLSSVGAQVLEYGGYASSSSSSGLSPPMGSGNKASMDLYASAYFGHVKYINEEYQLLDFNDPQIVQRSNKGCYDLIDWGFVSPKLGYIFTYGGPGGHCN